MKQKKQNESPKLNREQELKLLESSKQQRNLDDLQSMVHKLMHSLESLAYKIEHTKSEKKKELLTKRYEKKLYLVMSLQQGNFSVQTH